MLYILWYGDFIIFTLTSEQNTFPVAMYKDVEYDF